VGFNNDNTRNGINVGVPTSDSQPIVLTHVESEYDYSTSPTHGESFNGNDFGDTEHWSFVVDPASGQDMGGFLIHYYGIATFLDGTGVFAGAVGSSVWESFEVGTGPIAPNVWGHAVVSIDRYTIRAVPEPQTYALMLVGMGLVGAAAMRRREQL
jgi:PEP-CTERM motif